jgi:hypothetical protein
MMSGECRSVNNGGCKTSVDHNHEWRVSKPLSTHHCGLPMFYNRHCSRFNTLHSWLWFTAVLQPPLFTLQHYPLMIVVYRCFTSPILHASTLSTHHCGLPMFYNRHCSRFDNIHSSLWFTDVYNRHCSRFDTLHSWLWSTDVLQPPLFTLRQSPLIIVVWWRMGLVKHR